MKKLTVGVVRWRDAFSQVNDAVRRSEFESEFEIVSAGLLVRNGKRFVSLALEHHPDGRVRHVLHIPRGMILDMVTYPAAKRRK